MKKWVTTVALLALCVSCEKVNVNERDEYRRSELHYAALAYGSKDFAQRLVEGFNPNEQDVFGRTAMHYVCLSREKKDNMRRLFGNNFKRKDASLFSSWRPKEVIQADPNIQDNWGNTPLHIAVRELQADYVAILTGNDEQTDNNQDGSPFLPMPELDLSIRNKDGITALELAFAAPSDSEDLNSSRERIIYYLENY